MNKAATPSAHHPLSLETEHQQLLVEPAGEGSE